MARARRFLSGVFCGAAILVVAGRGEEPKSASNSVVEDLDFSIVDDARNEEKDASEKTESKGFEVKWSPDSRVFDEIFYIHELGDPKRILFEGVKLFPEEELRCALALDSKYQAAARPSNDIGNFLDTLAKRLSEGYLHSGCQDAKVTARLDGARNAIVVQVEEGARYLMGEIRVVGSAFVDERALAEWLTTPQAPRPWYYSRDSEYVESGSRDTTLTAWSPGKTTRFDTLGMKELNDAIWIALVELGFPYTKYRFELAPNPRNGTANLIVEVLEDRPKCTVEFIRVGNSDKEWEDSERDELLSHLELAPGAPFSASLLEDIDRKLKESSRFMTRTIYIHLRSNSLPIESAEQNVVGLALEIKTCDFARPLGEPLDPVDEVLRKSAKWLESVEDGDRDLVVTWESGSGIDQSNEAGRVRLIISSEGVVSEVRGRFDPNLAFNHSIIISPDHFLFTDWSAHAKFVVRKPLPFVRFQVNMQPSHMKLAAGFANEEQVTSSPQRNKAEIEIDPAALISFAHLPDTTSSFDNGVLSIKSPTDELQFDQATGEFLHFRSWSVEGSPFSVMSVKIEKGAYNQAVADIQRRGADLPNQFDEERPGPSTVSFVVRQIARQPLVQANPGLGKLFDAFATAVMKSEWPHDVDETIRYLAARKSNHGEEFEIPGRQGPVDDIVAYVDTAASITVAVNDNVFSRGSWPWTLIRQYALYERLSLTEKLGETTHAELNLALREEHNRLLRSGEIGPIGYLALAARYRTTHPRYATYLSQYALYDVSGAAFLKDIYAVTAGSDWLSPAVCAVADELSRLSREEQQQCIDVIPDKWRAPLKRLLYRRQMWPNETPDVAMREALLQSWHSGLHDAVEAELRSLSVQVAEKPEADESAVK